MKAKRFDQEREPRSLDEIIKDFENSAGNFKQFHDSLNMREQLLFKGWLHTLRATPSASTVSE